MSLDPFQSRMDFESLFNQGFDHLIEQAPKMPELLIAMLANVTCGGEEAIAVYKQQLFSLYDQITPKVLDGSLPIGDEYKGIYGKIEEGGGLSKVLQSTRIREIGPFLGQLNPIRALRPKRTSGEVAYGLYKPFDPGKFNYLHRSVEPEIFHRGNLAGLDAWCVYNMFPFGRMHFLLLPEAEVCHPQFLTSSMAQWLWYASCEIWSGIPEMLVGYNAVGAYSSVNHLHFQLLADMDVPVLDPAWKHNGGDWSYPASVEIFDDVDGMTEWLDFANSGNQAYNLILANEKVYCFGRKKQKHYEHASWTTGFAFLELGGMIITCTSDDLENLQEYQIVQELCKVSL